MSLLWSCAFTIPLETIETPSRHPDYLRYKKIFDDRPFRASWRYRDNEPSSTVSNHWRTTPFDQTNDADEESHCERLGWRGHPAQVDTRRGIRRRRCRQRQQPTSQGTSPVTPRGTGRELRLRLPAPERRRPQATTAAATIRERRRRSNRRGCWEWRTRGRAGALPPFTEIAFFASRQGQPDIDIEHHVAPPAARSARRDYRDVCGQIAAFRGRWAAAAARAAKEARKAARAARRAARLMVAA